MKAKAAGRYKGRAPVPDSTTQQVLLLYAKGIKPAKIAKDLSLGRSTVYRLLKRPPNLHSTDRSLS
ncbi:helix-turn-helix domain-containing protein [Epibacterium ulvae]|uniref:helix-turn-helix domain-containing protein n=1 Tax=Epibacterium ulvae TaxID=1156985 RepID=UPI000C227B41